MTDGSHRVAVVTPVAQLFAEPRVASAQISQLLAGRVAEVLETRDDWYRIRGPDHYEGWMHRGYLTSAPDETTRRSVSNARISLGCVTTDSTGARRAMPLGAYLTPDERVLSGDVIDAAEHAAAFPADGSAIGRSARLYFEGTSYFWGGITPWGADCSGLAQSVYWLHGIQLQRDAWQQATQGVAASDNPVSAAAGDLLFFSDRLDQYITHVAISLGGGCLVHLALGRGGYAVERLDDTRDPYVRKLLERFVTARRIL
ncbi:MAG: SH3 domain-containing C40 family peptidase [Gemmatimonadaceae bacterium]